MATITLAEVISALQEHANDSEIQIAIRHQALFNVFTIKNFRFHLGEVSLMVNSQDSRTNFQLTKSDIIEIEDVYSAEEIQWRAAAFEIKCINGIEIIINILA